MQTIRERNWNIARLRGTLPALSNMIPPDVDFSKEDREALRLLSTKLLKSLDKAKVKRFTCASCNSNHSKSPTKNKKAYACDYCGNYYEELYLVR